MTDKVDPVAHAKYILELLARDGTPGMGVSFGEAALARVVLAAADLAVAWRDRTERYDGIKNVHAKHKALAAALKGAA